MTSNFYDVVVVGTQIGSLVAGALLARRGFRVLVAGHDDLPATYSYKGYRLPRGPFTLVGTEAPAIRRVFQELALSQLFRRRAVPQEPLFQVVLPRHRIDVLANGDDLSREFGREFPEVSRQIELFYASLTRHNADLDRVLEKDLVMPPETFFERRELARAVTQSPFGKDGSRGDVFGEFPENHPFWQFVNCQVRFAGGLDPQAMTPLAVTRLHGAWMRGTHAFDGGLDAFKRLLFEKVGMHSGEVRERDRIESLVFKGGRVVGVRVAGQDELTGCNFLVWGGDPSSLVRLLEPNSLPRRVGERLEGLRVTLRRHVLNVLIDGGGLPVGMGRDVFSLGDPAAPLEGCNLLHVQVDSPSGADHHVLTASTLVRAASSSADLESHRARVLDHVRTLVPFLDEHAILVDSPSDDLPLEDLAERASVRPEDRAASGPARMEPVYLPSAPGVLGVTALPNRSGIKNVLFADRETIPGLGLEGLFLAGWSAARLITRTDRKKERMRRELWAKIEI
ncbi:MAG: NAD(P)-binding protein [Deltaproteobacteria bacterium]|nr:NAD(P)-binding protein [Deltaproteobacteria bacterium]